MRQFFLQTDPQNPPQVGDRLLLDSEESHHLSTVLRGGRSEVLHLTNGCGLRLEAKSCGQQGKLQEVQIVGLQRDEDESREPQLVLACAVVKGKRFEWALEKATELGVHHIVPLITARGEIKPRDGKQDRWRTILISALKQSGRSWLPTLAETTPLEAALKVAAGGTVFFGAVPGELDDDSPHTQAWSDVLNASPDELPASLMLMIGPEGGWSPQERRMLLDAGARPVDLGRHILRTETAAVAGLFALHSVRAEWLQGARSSGS